MKIYTGGGDRGKTGLFSGERISKASARVDAYGDVDELNSVVGALVASIGRGDNLLIDRLRQIQSRLFGAGAWLAVTPGSESASLLETFPREHVQWLENAIDEMDAQLPPLKHFILPGGCRASAYAHMARTVCRRAERHAVFALENETGTIADDENTKNVVAFLNRLSDFLFVLARYLNQLAGERDIVWKKR